VFGGVGNSGWPSSDGGFLLPDLMKEGCLIEYIRSSSALLGHHWHLHPVHSGKKETTAGTLEKYGDQIK
jgi:hypothetical protein